MRERYERFVECLTHVKDALQFLIFLVLVTIFALCWHFCPDVMQDTIEVKVWELFILFLLLFLKLPKPLLTAIRILREWNVWILDKEKGWIRACKRR